MCLTIVLQKSVFFPQNSVNLHCRTIYISKFFIEFRENLEMSTSNIASGGKLKLTGNYTINYSFVCIKKTGRMLENSILLYLR